MFMVNQLIGFGARRPASGSPPTALPTIVGLGALGGTGGGTTFTVDWPVGYQSGDIGVMICCGRAGAFSTPSGWTEIANSPQTVGSGSTSTSLSIFTKVAGASESSVTVSNGATIHVVAILVLRGGAFDVSAGTTVPAHNNATWAFPSLTTSVNNCMVIHALAEPIDNSSNRYSAYTNANLANITEQLDSGTATGIGCGLVIVTAEAATAGSIGTTTCTGPSFACDGALITLSVKPG